MKRITFTCSRCHVALEGDFDKFFTVGYYNVSPSGAWHKFARKDELILCDMCMWNDPEYQKVYRDPGGPVVAAAWRGGA